MGALAAIWIFARPADTDVIRTVGYWEHPEIDTYEFQHAPVSHVVERLTQLALEGDDRFHLLDTQLLAPIIHEMTSEARRAIRRHG